MIGQFIRDMTLIGLSMAGISQNSNISVSGLVDRQLKLTLSIFSLKFQPRGAHGRSWIRTKARPEVDT